MEFINGLFDTSDFPARWHCGNWSPAHGWLHILSDVGVWAAYFAIPLVLAYFVTRRRDLPFRRVFLLFVAFILLCGTTHLMEAVIFWWPGYRLAGALKLVTAVVSWVTVLALVRVAPAVLAMRTPEELQQEAVARTDAERRLKEANAELERRVEERTADLGRSVATLQRERELLRTTLMSIGDGVVTADPDGIVTGLNGVAEALTGWTNAESQGQPLDAVFRIVNETTRLLVENPVLRALKEGVVVGLANHTVLISKDGTERPIEDSAAPIRSASGEVVGCVLVFRDVGEKRRLEGERQEAQERVVATLESVTDGFMRYDRDWRIVYVNAEAERINRLTRSEMLGKTPWEVFPALVGTKLEDEFRRAVAERVTVEFENYYEPFGRWFSLKGYPTADGGLTTFIRDITEQKAHREALAASEARYRAIGESIDYGVWVCDTEGRNTYASESFLRLVGITQNQCSEFGWGDVLHPDDAAATIAAWRECVRTQGTWDRQHRFKGVDGGWHDVLARGVPLRNEAGELLGWAGINLDIGRLLRAEREVVRIAAESDRQRRLYETVLSSTPDFVYVFSLDHRVLYANDSLIKMWGRGQEGAIGKTFLEIGYEPWHAEMHDREIDQVRATRQPLRGEVPFTGTHGRRQYDYIFVPILGADGEVEAVAGTTRDVTERHQAETALRESEERAAFVRRSSGVGFWYCDLPFDVLQWDELVKAHFHLPPDATVTIQTFFNRLHPDDREPTRQAMERSIAGRTPYHVDYRTVNPDTGAVKWVRAIGRTF